MAAALSCPLCLAPLGSMSLHGRRTHIGRCREEQERGAAAVGVDVPPDMHEVPDYDEDARSRGSDTAATPDVPAPAVAAALPRVVPARGMPKDSFEPFLSQADSDMATLYVRNFGLGVGMLDSILEIARRGERLSRTTKELMSTVDTLEGMRYKCAEITIPGYPEGLYRLFYRQVVAAVAFVLRKHGRDLLHPVVLPPDYAGNIEEMWQAKRYQALLRDFQKVAEPADILLPLIFFSGSWSSLLLVCPFPMELPLDCAIAGMCALIYA